MWNPNVEHAENVAGFVRKGHGDFSIGEVNTTLLVRDNHPLLILTDGSPCPSAEHLRASTAVRFICDTSVFGSGNPQFVAQLPPDDASACAFFVEWRTHAQRSPNARNGSITALIASPGRARVPGKVATMVIHLRLMDGAWRRGFSRLPSLPEEEEEAIMGVDNDDHGRHSLPDQAARLPESGGQGGESESTTPAKGLDTNGVIRL
ncbi:hypothetical protein EW146_g8566 [Bondarzewia mesenterica]|uniref:Uncharacterized protein n=1 Tax=Bondarzewia mesenterica TaxID=1095465 RepID=A0A4V3XDI3_9AGAM|nr:hypothetical protein EW146_g8566 [Bondarzewia mesenterica]